ncbi:hypothetical protein ACOBQJ_14930 [Pelotomaculum propionicicum]|uniref:hypothetical protein n=1 Tax=Pelotomaculum propionicicum TaxID=258475 RepID=UPI003B7E2C1E
MTKIHKGFYLGSWTAGGALIIIMLFSGWVALLKGNRDLSADLYIYAIIPYTYLGIVWLVLLYKAWAAIQDGHASVTPVKAVVFMLIPFYRYYWIFRTFRNYAGEFNAYIARHCLAVPNLSDGLFTAFSILWITYGILQSALKGTGLQVLLAGAYLVIGAMTLNTLCNGLIGLAGALRDKG